MIGGAFSFLIENQQALGRRALEHIDLMAIALLAASAAGLPAGIVASRVRVLALPLITIANVIQTVPSVALLGFLLPFLGIGRGTAVLALFLYALLPIVRNTITGLQGVERNVTEAARGMGMSAAQILWSVELPLALPVIFAGIRTAAVINVGVTTLSALVGAGGLGVFIFRGLATNNTAMILLGAVPAAVLALLADSILAFCEHGLRRRRPFGLIVAACLLLAALMSVGWRSWGRDPQPAKLRLGFTSEFMARPDGYKAWQKHYQLPAFSSRELDPGLLYDAVRLGSVDAVCGFSTDGRIVAYGLRELVDDRKFFPSYDAALLVRNAALERFPSLRPLLEKLGGAIDGDVMRALNMQVDVEKMTPAQAASAFLAEWAPAQGIAWDASLAEEKFRAGARSDIVIGTKNFTEQYILGQIVSQLVNGASGLRAGLKPGLGGTSICFHALERGDIDIYPEYSGTLLSSVLKPPPEKFRDLIRSRDVSDDFLRHELDRRHGLSWLAPFGFGNTYAILVREDDPRFAETFSVSDLRLREDL